MSEHVFKLPDLGEGTVEAEIVQWHVKPGDAVREGDLVVDVMTDKANIEVPAPVTGTVLRTTGEPGDTVAVGSELMAIEAAEDTKQPARKPATQPASAPPEPQEKAPARKARRTKSVSAPAPVGPVPEPAAEAAPVPPPDGASAPAARPAPEPVGLPVDKAVRTSPAVRRRAKEAGIDLSAVAASGPRGRILMRDLEAHLAGQPSVSPTVEPPSGVGEVTEVKIIGVRRLIATRLQAAKQQIPHFAYVEQVDVTALESLRRHLNETRSDPGLTYLPFIGLALIKALKAFPQCNAHFDAERGVLRQFSRVHLGVATQTPDGLKVPVVHNADARTLWQLAGEIRRVTTAARDNTAGRDVLTGSTITLTSLGRLGGIASTPVINAPETAIIGINKAIDTPVVIDGQVTVRLIMNLSSSFDHRFVDGHDAASLIQAVKGYLEQPATLFIDG